MKEGKTIGEINTKKYMYPPEWPKIQDFINELGISFNHFERFYHLPYNTICQVKAGSRELPAHFWHIIYERIKPTYGSGFLYEPTKKPIKKLPTHSLTNLLTNESSNHDRLITVK